MALVFNDDFSTTFAASWNTAYWAVIGAGVSYNANSSLAGEGYFSQTNTSGKWGKARSVATSVDGEIYCDLRWTPTANGMIAIGLSGLWSADGTHASTVTQGVWVQVNTTSSSSAGFTFMQKSPSVAAVQIGTAQVLPNAGTNYSIRVRKEGNNIYGKAWERGTAEPGWLWTGTLSTTWAAGSAFVNRDGGGTTGNGTDVTGAIDNFNYDNLVASVVNASYTATPVTGSGTMPTATVAIGTTQTATVITATATAPTATRTTTRNPTYVANAMTGSASAPTAAAYIVNHKTVTATVMTGTALGTSAVQRSSISTLPTDDYYFANSGGTTFDLATLYGDANYNTVMRFDNLPANQVVQSATLSLRPQQADSGNIRVYPITAPFVGRPGAKGSFTLGASQVLAFNGTTNRQDFDVTGLISGSVYGFFMEYASGSFFTIASAENATDTYRPLFAMTYHSEQVHVNPTADVMTATAEMPEALVILATDVNTLAEPFTADATAPEAIGVADMDVEVPTEPMYAEAEMPDGQFTLPATIEATPLFGSGESPEAVASTTLGVNALATPMKGAARFVTIAQVNDTLIEGEAVNDNYFNRVQAKNPSYWVRMLSPVSPLNNYVTGQPVADVRGLVTLGQNDGPDGRPSIHFGGGGYLEQREPTGTNQDENVPYMSTNWSGDVPHTLEFSFRTTKPNQFILAGSDSYLDLVTGAVSDAQVASEVSLAGGKIVFKQYRSYTPQGTRDVKTDETTLATGTRVLTDNEWHHVVIRHVKSAVRDEYGFEVWIDGKMEFRRLLNSGWTAGFPDYIGGRPTYLSGVTLPALPNSRQFDGDMGEIVFYPMLNLPKDDIERNYYAFMGWVPVEAEPMEADAEMTDAIGRGNKKKALYLYFTGRDEVFGGGLGGVNTLTGDATSYDPDPSLVADSYQSSLAPRITEEVSELMGFKVFTKSVMVNYNNGVNAYRDAVTDEQALIDLTRDVNLAEYDVIMFKDWPDESHERDYLEYNYPGQLARLLEQLKDANEAGTELMVTNPRLAIDLGIVDKVEWAPAMTEVKALPSQGNAIGSYDYGSAVKFPWNITASDNLANGSVFASGIGQPQDLTEATLNNKAFYFYDTNKNNRFRLRAKVPGLTDIPAYMLADAVFHIDQDIQGWQGAAYKYLNAMDGLNIGDEWIFNGSSVIAPAFLDAVTRRYNRYEGAYATPLANVKYGTVVTTFGDKMWVEKSIVDNPYKNYATTIILEIGDKLEGRTVGGRIFVNFTEQPNQGIGWAKQVLPHTPDATPDAKWPYGYGGAALNNEGAGETAQQTTWDYSWTRTTLTTTQTSNNVSVMQVQQPDGSYANVRLGSGGDNDRLNMVRSSQLFPVIGLPGAEMFNRGLIWLGEAPVVEEGSVVVRAEAMTASANGTTATPVIQKSVRVQAQSVGATAQMPEADEAKSGDALYLASTMTAEGTFTQGGDAQYRAEAMVASATMPDVASKATGESITLRLPRQKQITLRMEAR